MILNTFSTGFTPDAELLLIAVRSHTGEYRSWKSLDSFLEYFLSTDDKIVIGFNILKFDIPFLLLKASSSSRFQEFFRKINYSNIVDLFTVLTFQNKGIIKGLDFYLESKEIKKDFASDQNIIRNIQSSEEEIRKKLEAINSLYWRMKND